MTKYLTGKPFSAPTSNGKLSTEEYFIAVGALCPVCKKSMSKTHKCKGDKK